MRTTTYDQSYVDACRKNVDSLLAKYRKLAKAAPAGLAGFEAEMVAHQLLALDHYFAHRLRGKEGKDGNPLNESA